MGAHVRHIVANLLVLLSVAAALIVGWQGHYSHATYFMSNAIFIELVLQADMRAVEATAVGARR